MNRVDRSRLPDVGPDPSFSFPVIVRHVLPNGLQLRTIEHHSVPIVSAVMQIDGGSSADPASREGLAAMTADMVDEGTGSRSALDVSEAWARIGADYDVDVGADATLFGVTTLSRFATRGLALLADLLIRPSFLEADFERVRQLRLDRLRQMKDLPPVVAERAFLRLLYEDHPYGHLPIGSANSLAQMSLEQVNTFHASLFRPSHSTLILAGAMSHGELRALAESIFGGWADDPPVNAPTVVADRLANGPAQRLAVIPRDAAPQSEIRIGQLSARRDTPDHAALLVMNAVLGGQFVSRINLKLREEKGYTYGARTGFDWRRGLAPFMLQASVHTAATADAIRDSLRELEAIRESRPPSADELTLAKASLTRGYPRNFETAQQVARSVAQLALYRLPDTYFEAFIPRVNAIQATDVTRVAAQYISPSQLTTLVVGDHPSIAASLATLDLGDPQLLPAEI